jgi:hypothetical protein
MHVPWRPDAWIEVEDDVHELECTGRPLNRNRGMVDRRGARRARNGIQDSVIVRGAGVRVATETRLVDGQGAPFGSSAVAMTRAVAALALPNSRYSPAFAVKVLPAG